MGSRESTRRMRVGVVVLALLLLTGCGTTERVRAQVRKLQTSWEVYRDESVPAPAPPCPVGRDPDEWVEEWDTEIRGLAGDLDRAFAALEVTASE